MPTRCNEARRGNTFTIFGANGFVGSNLSQFLEEQGYTVNRVPRDGIICDYPGHIVYCIGMTADFRNRPLDTVEAHVSKLKKVIEENSFNSFTFLSSTRLYNGKSSKEFEPLTVSPENMNDLYNISKICGESLTLNHGYNVPSRVIRLSNVVGPNEGQRDTFLGQIIRASRTGVLKLQDHIQFEKDYIYIDDVVKFIYGVVTRELSGIFNCSSGKNISHKTWITELEKFYEFELVQNDQAQLRKSINIYNSRTDYKLKNFVDPLSKITHIINGENT